MIWSCLLWALSPRRPKSLQEALHPFSFLRTEWTKPALVVDEHDSRSLEVDHHVGLVIAVDIDEAEGHRDEVGVSPVELGTDVDAGVAGVATRQFDDFNAPVQVDGQKMTGHAR